MIIFLFGQNHFFIKKKTKELIDEYKKKHQSGLNLLKFDSDDLDFKDFKNKIETISMFKEKKLIILKNIFSPSINWRKESVFNRQNKIFKEKFLDYIQKSNLKKDKERIVIISELFLSEPNKIKDIKKDKLFLELTKSPVLYKEYKNLSFSQLKKWLFDYFKKENVKLGDGVLDYFISLMPADNLEFIEKEIEKLILYTRDKNNFIKKEDVDLLISETNFNQNVFKIIDLLTEKKKGAVINLIGKFLKSGKNELYLLAVILNHIRNLIKIRSLLDKNKSQQEICKKLNLHPFVFQKNYQQAQKFSLEDLKKIYFLLFETDVNIKTGKIEPGLALDLLVSKI